MTDDTICPAHSGLEHRVKTVEGRQDQADSDRKDLREAVYSLKLYQAKLMGGIAFGLVVLQVALKYLPTVGG